MRLKEDEKPIEDKKSVCLPPQSYWVRLHGSGLVFGYFWDFRWLLEMASLIRILEYEKLLHKTQM